MYPMRKLLSSFVLLCLVATASPSLAEPAHVLAAGSLVAAVTQIVRSSGLGPSEIAEPTFGPSGGLRERIEKGEPADLLLSADMQHPRTLAKARPQTLVVPFARNTLCLFARESAGLTQSNALDRMLDPKLRLVTSTPKLDP